MSRGGGWARAASLVEGWAAQVDDAAGRAAADASLHRCRLEAASLAAATRRWAVPGLVRQAPPRQIAWVATTPLMPTDIVYVHD